jgi:hypothetical protein
MPQSAGARRAGNHRRTAAVIEAEGEVLLPQRFFTAEDAEDAEGTATAKSFSKSICSSKFLCVLCDLCGKKRFFSEYREME